MLLAHPSHTHGSEVGGLETFLPIAALLTLAVGYAILAHLRSREPRGWSPWRTVSFLTGVAMLLLALVPPLSPFPQGDFRGHMYQHLLIGMYAPLGLALGAPVTMVLRSVPSRLGKVIGKLLRWPPTIVLTHPATALVLNLGGLYLLYFTPLYNATTDNPALHHLVHVHFFVAGYLFAYSIAGPDPAPHRPSVRSRLVLLGVAIFGHAVLSQLLYAGLFVQVPVPVDQLRGAADLMYYGGDIAELLLALAMVTTWRPHRRTSTIERVPTSA